MYKNPITRFQLVSLSFYDSLVSFGGTEFGVARDGVGLFNPAVVVLPMEQLRIVRTNSIVVYVCSYSLLFFAITVSEI